MTMEQQIAEVVARAWCHPANSHKPMDPDLVNAIVEEVAKSFTPAVTPGHK